MKGHKEKFGPEASQSAANVAQLLRLGFASIIKKKQPKKQLLYLLKGLCRKILLQAHFAENQKVKLQSHPDHAYLTIHLPQE